MGISFSYNQVKQNQVFFNRKKEFSEALKENNIIWWYSIQSIHVQIKVNEKYNKMIIQILPHEYINAKYILILRQTHGILVILQNTEK